LLVNKQKVVLFYNTHLHELAAQIPILPCEAGYPRFKSLVAGTDTDHQSFDVMEREPLGRVMQKILQIVMGLVMNYLSMMKQDKRRKVPMKQFINQLVLFEHLLSDPLVEAYVRMHSSKDEENIREDYFYIVRTLIQQETTFEDYLVASIFSSEHPMLLALCKGEQKPSEREWACLRHDLYIIRRLLKHDLNLYCEKVGDDNTLLKYSVISKRHKPLVKAVLEFFDSIDDKPIFQPQCDSFFELLKHFGCGEFALHQAFYLNDNS
jgi:hypothetical protein